MSSLLNLVCSTAWAVRPEALQAIVALVQREDISRHAVAAACHWSEARQREAARAYETSIPLRAVGSQDATPVQDSYRLYRRGSTAILPVTGPITRYSNFFQAMSGQGTSVEALAKDFYLALNDPNFDSILLSIDSPGGEVNGINEFSDMIYASRVEKPIWAYVSDLGASAAYWIASAAERIVVAETAAVGSIGCLAVFKRSGVEGEEIAFVSNVSPRKKMDPLTEDGAEQIQAMVNTYGQIFVDKVARNRGIPATMVTSDYGQGGLVIGADAVMAMMAEEVGTFEGCLMAMKDPADHPVKRPKKMRMPMPAAAHTLTDRVAMLEPLAATMTTSLVTSTIEGLQPPTVVPPPEDPAPSPTALEVAMPDTQITPPVDSTQAEMAALRAENQRLRAAAYQAQGEQFADAKIQEMRAFPAERGHLVALYVQAATDDERLGTTTDGSLRTQMLANAIAARTSVSFLTAEAIGPTAMQAISQRVTAASKDPNAPMTEVETNKLLGMSPLGKTLIPNGRVSN